ncbi:MAG: MBL fold metallo-hydrolase [Bacteroidales bacterium]|jgi:glyoxylase-like metal-dependent hydrolase (beta-lactamase superfamily II)|nr:MBL fold metallo-hydrolase [Bacteroidales bacterium]
MKYFRNFSKNMIGGMLIAFMPTAKLAAQDVHQVETFDVGSYKISVLSEGHNDGNTGLLTGATPEILKQYAPNGTFPMGMNAFLVRTPDKTVLVDAGYGKNLLDYLKTLNVTPEKVDIVLLTHLHGDHIGGMLKDGKPVFPQAEVYMAQAEHDYWSSDAEMNKLAENRRGGFVQARAVIQAYRSTLHLFVPAALGSASVELIPGFTGIAAYGHTPGHTGFLLQSGGSRLLIWGDLTHAMAVQMPHPEVALSFDVNPAQAVAIRKEILAYVAKHKIPIAGMHIVPPAMGKVEKSKTKGESYRFEPFSFKKK